MPSAITKSLRISGALIRSPHVQKNDKYCGMWIRGTGQLLTMLGRIINHSSRGRNRSLVIHNMCHFIDHNWSGPIVLREVCLGPNLSLWTEIKHVWSEERIMGFPHLRMKRQRLYLDDQVTTLITARASEVQ